SMIDVFVIAVLSALVRMGGLMNIYPAMGALMFALVVIMTMFSDAGMVATDYIKFLPPMHIIACCAAIVLVFAGVLTQKETFNSFE
ncbi:paraquat-inducible protein A, partial [Salmonella enterica subsp. enterica serovar Anatum]|nr:paraquat-inducible protein A [Salmonella enterica subsp. enterica serovar Anatum]